MVGRRVILFKRPAVLCAVAFVSGIILERCPAFVLFGVVCGYVCGRMLLGELRRGKRSVGKSDKLLLLAPLFLLAGFMLMHLTRERYERYGENFAGCLGEEGKLLAIGTVSELSVTGNGICFRLKAAEAVPYGQTEEEYSSVGCLMVYADGLEAENGSLKEGQQVFIFGKGSRFEPATNPGEFDAHEYYFSKGITGSIQGNLIRITNRSYHRLDQALFQAKQKLLNSYVTFLGEEGAGVISSMLLGERALLSEETEELYRHGGISHILAISGLHVSLIGQALYAVLRRTFLGRNGAIPVACLGVVVYGSFVRAGISTKRAVIMFLLLLLATALGRTYDSLSAMAISMIVILAQTPGALFTASFQLSYGAAYGASVLADVFRMLSKQEKKECIKVAEEGFFENLRKIWRGGRQKRREILIFSLAIQAVSVPLTIYHFFEYPLYGFFLNPVVVPLVTILLLCGLLSGVCGLFWPVAGYFFAGGTKGILFLYEILCSLVENLPFSVLLCGRPEVWRIALYYAALTVYIWQYGKRSGCFGRKDDGILQGKIKGVLQAGVPLFLPLCLIPAAGTGLECAFLDVGQGECIVIRERESGVFLVDGGSTGTKKIGEKTMIPYLKANGIRVIDCVFVSHTDADHISGITEILERMPVLSAYRTRAPGYAGTPVIKKIVLPVTEQENGEYHELEELAKEKGVELHFLGKGEQWETDGKLKFLCLAPEKSKDYPDRNAASMILLASYGQTDLLLTGDTEKAGEESLLEEPEDWQNSVEVLKVAHHGSMTSSSPQFVRKISPLISIISCGRENRYGHPHKETVSTLRDAGSRIYRTDKDGCVTLQINGKIRVETYLPR